MMSLLAVLISRVEFFDIFVAGNIGIMKVSSRALRYILCGPSSLKYVSMSLAGTTVSVPAAVRVQSLLFGSGWCHH
jgi:hypothetical protein